MARVKRSVHSKKRRRVVLDRAKGYYGNKSRSYRAANEQVEDVTQEVFLRLYRNLQSTPGDDLLRAWLLRVTLNVARNTLRGQSRSMVRDHEYHKSTTENGFFAEAPETDYERRLDIEEARRALAKIKEPMRSCLLLKQQGLSYREIAHSLSLKETNIGSLVARGRKEFARVYGKIGGKR
jgi:RNA polymerase sigma factor (sigma-70 family)